MNRTLRFFIYLIFLTILSANPATAAAQNAIGWRQYSTNELNMAKEKNRPVLLFAKSDYCHWCQKLRSETFQNAALIKLINKNYVPVMLDIDKNTALARYYQVRALPTFIIIGRNGEIKKQFTGYMSAEELADNLR